MQVNTPQEASRSDANVQTDIFNNVNREEAGEAGKQATRRRPSAFVDYPCIATTTLT